jgi:hypothetical protein
MTVLCRQPRGTPRVCTGVEMVLATGVIWSLAAGLAIAFGAAAKRGDARRAAVIAEARRRRASTSRGGGR